METELVLLEVTLERTQGGAGAYFSARGVHWAGGTLRRSYLRSLWKGEGRWFFPSKESNALSRWKLGRDQKGLLGPSSTWGLPSGKTMGRNCGARVSSRSMQSMRISGGVTNRA